MNPRDWFYLAGLVAQLIGVAYVYGKLTGKVGEHTRQHEAHDTRFTNVEAEQVRQWESIGRNGEKLAVVEAKVQGLEGRRHHV